MTIIAASDPHSYSNPQQFSPQHLVLDLELDFKAKRMRGTCRLDFKPWQSDVGRLQLDTRDLDISAVTNDQGEPLRYEMGSVDPIMGRLLSIEIPDGTITSVIIHYSTREKAAAVQWLSRQQTSSGEPFMFTQSQAILARTWIPCMDTPGVRTTYEATIHVPQGLSAVMSARHGEHDPETGTYRFRMDQPIPSYLIALAAGKLAFRQISARTGVYSEPELLDDAAWEFADAEKMLRTAESLVGPYLWERWDILVLPPSFPFGGMENPRLTFATPTVIAGDRSLVNLLAHELAHSWSGNLVTNNTWDDFWLNEGFTTYIEQRIMEELYGDDIAKMIILLGQRGLQETVAGLPDRDTHLKLNLRGRDPDAGMTEVAYEKGANLLRLIEDHVGRGRFDTYLRGYFQRFAFSTLSTQDFVNDVGRHLFAEEDEEAWLNRVVATWIEGPGVPDSMIRPTSVRFDQRIADAEAFADGGVTPDSTDDWVTHEWLQFLHALPETLTTKQLKALDKKFAFSEAKNSEILFAWLMIAIENGYSGANKSLEAFLKRQGRRKFVKPLFEAMLARPKTKSLALKIFKQQKKRYHPITRLSVQAVIDAHS